MSTNDIPKLFAKDIFPSLNYLVNQARNCGTQCDVVIAGNNFPVKTKILCKNLVKEFEGTGTTVNAVVPGFVETPWQKEKPEQIKQNIYRKTAIHRFATIDEIVDAFRFCIDNSFVNGSLIEVNGGYSYK